MDENYKKFKLDALEVFRLEKKWKKKQKQQTQIK